MRKLHLPAIIFTLFTSTLPLASKQPEKGNDWKIQEIDSVLAQGKGSIEIIHAARGEYIKAYKSKEGILIFQGGIILKMNQAYLFAETVKINPETGEVYAEGDITLKDGVNEVKGSSFLYNIKMKTGVIYKIDAYFEPVYYMGESIKISSSEDYTISAAYLSTCEADSPHYFIKAKKLWIQPDNRIIASGVVYYVGDVPVFYLPLLVQTDIGTGIESLIGYSQGHGLYLQNTYFFGMNRSPIGPDNAQLMFDYYQLDGFYFGNYMEKHSQLLNYEFTIGGAWHKNKELSTLPGASPGFTNLIKQPDGSYKKEEEFWYELNGGIKVRWRDNTVKDAQSSIDLKFIDYSNPEFLNLYKRRHIPTSSIDSFWWNREIDTSYPPLRDTLWSFNYTENWGGNHFNMLLERKKRWIRPPGESTYSYKPLVDIFPKIDFNKEWYLLKPKGKYFNGARNIFKIKILGNTEFTGGTEIDRGFSYDISDNTMLFFPIFNILTYNPSVGYGLTNRFTRNENIYDLIENKRKSYQYLTAEHSLKLGVPVAMLSLKHSFTYITKTEEVDPVIGRDLQHYILFSANGDYSPFGSFSAFIVRDMRNLEFFQSEKDRWSPLVLQGNLIIDFVNGSEYLVPVTRSRQSNYFILSLENRFGYDIHFQTPLYNELSASIDLGGYKFLFFQALRQFKTGFIWDHDFLNNQRNFIRAFFEINIDLFRYWGFLFGVNSGSSLLSDSVDARPYNVITTNPAILFNNKETPFILNDLHASIRHDLHRWELEVEFSLNRSWYSTGADELNGNSYYDKRVFLSINLKGFEGAGVPKTEVFQDRTPRQAF